MLAPRPGRRLAVFAWLLAVLLFASPAAHANPVDDWSAIGNQVIIVNAARAGTGNIDFAYMYIAIYDAVNAIDGGYQPYLVKPNANPTDSKEAAAATAAHRVLASLFTAQQSSLQAQYDTYVAGLPDNPAGSKAAGVTIGESAAAAMLIARTGDGRFGPAPALYPPAPGVWPPPTRRQGP